MTTTITDRILAAADACGGLAALSVQGPTVEFDAREGLTA